jgi:hypothetical protein
MTAQIRLLNAKIITHHSQKTSHALFNHCNGFSGFGYPDPAAAAVVEPASSAAECCSGQRAESKENSSSPAHKIDHTVLYTDKQKLVKLTKLRAFHQQRANIHDAKFPTFCSFGNFSYCNFFMV